MNDQVICPATALFVSTIISFLSFFQCRVLFVLSDLYWELLLVLYQKMTFFPPLTVILKDFLHSFFKIYLFIYFWLHWVFVAARRLSLVAGREGYSLLRCRGFSLWWLLLLQSTDSRVHRLQQLWRKGSVVVAHGLQSTGSVVVVHRLSCFAACGIFLDQGSSPCLLHWQADS